MKGFKRLICLLLILVSTYVSSKDGGQRGRLCMNPCTVSMMQLVANVDYYNGKEIYVRGVFSKNTSGGKGYYGSDKSDRYASLYFNTDSYKNLLFENAVFIDFGENVNYKSAEAHFLEFKGVFNANNLGARSSYIGTLTNIDSTLPTPFGLPWRNIFEIDKEYDDINEKKPLGHISTDILKIISSGDKKNFPKSFSNTSIFIDKDFFSQNCSSFMRSEQELQLYLLKSVDIEKKDWSDSKKAGYCRIEGDFKLDKDVCHFKVWSGGRGVYECADGVKNYKYMNIHDEINNKYNSDGERSS